MPLTDKSIQMKYSNEWHNLGQACFYSISSSFIDRFFLNVPVLLFFPTGTKEMTVMTASLLGLRVKKKSDSSLCKEVGNRRRTQAYTHTRTHTGLGGFTVVFVKQSAGVWWRRRANERWWKWTVAESQWLNLPPGHHRRDLNWFISLFLFEMLDMGNVITYSIMLG